MIDTSAPAPTVEEAAHQAGLVDQLAKLQREAEPRMVTALRQKGYLIIPPGDTLPLGELVRAAVAQVLESQYVTKYNELKKLTHELLNELSRSRIYPPDTQEHEDAEQKIDSLTLMLRPIVRE